MSHISAQRLRPVLHCCGKCLDAGSPRLLTPKQRLSTTATPPKGMQMCHMCKYHIASNGRRGGMGGMCMDGGSLMGMMGAGACQVVEGRISPMGWCDLYAPA